MTDMSAIQEPTIIVIIIIIIIINVLILFECPNHGGLSEYLKNNSGNVKFSC